MPTVEISVDRDPVGSGQELAVAIRTSELAAAPGGRGPGASYALVLDASTSMSWPAEPAGPATRWTLALEAVRQLIGQLPAQDEIQVVAFSDRAWSLSPAMSVADLRASGLPDQVQEGNGTNIEAGLRLAYDRLSQSAATARRAILFSDGEPNVGASTAAGLGAVATQAASRDIYTDAVGMGAGADFELLQAVCAQGSTDHVPSADRSQAVINEIVGRFARQAQELAATGGEIIVDIHPLFPVTGVYQLHPVNRRLTAPVTAGPDGGQRVTIPLGAVGAGDERPLFVFRLRAPDKIIAKRVGLMTATGRLRTRSGVVPLDEATAAVSGIAVRPKINLEQLMVRVRAIDLEAEIAQTIKQASPTAHRDLYLEAKDRALREGLTELAEQYDLNLRGLQEGKHPNDVRNSGRARSSTSTRPSDALVEIPELDPGLVRRSDQATRSVSTRKLTRRVPPADR